MIVWHTAPWACIQPKYVADLMTWQRVNVSFHFKIKNKVKENGCWFEWSPQIRNVVGAFTFNFYCPKCGFRVVPFRLHLAVVFMLALIASSFRLSGAFIVHFAVRIWVFKGVWIEASKEVISPSIRNGVLGLVQLHLEIAYLGQLEFILQCDFGALRKVCFRLV